MRFRKKSLSKHFEEVATSRLLDSVKKNLQLDWTKKEDARAGIRLAVKKELRGKVPFSELDNLLKEVIEQAEGQYRDWPMEA